MFLKIDHIHDEGLDFKLLESKQHFDLDSPDCVLKEDVSIKGKLEKLGQEIICQGELQTELSVKCSRCLEDFSFPVNAKLKVYFVPQLEDNNLANEIELTEFDIDQEFYVDDKIDLTCPVRDSILLSLPPIKLCREDCAGLCFQCGKGLNKNDCGCEKENACDPRLAVLQQLKNKIK
jgi:uncharacterized protein